MSLYTVNPFEIDPIFHSEYCPAKRRITRGARNYYLFHSSKDIESANEQSQQISFALIIIKNAHVGASASSGGDVLESEA